jgi:hypothetical protein
VSIPHAVPADSAIEDQFNDTDASRKVGNLPVFSDIWKLQALNGNEGATI